LFDIDIIIHHFQKNVKKNLKKIKLLVPEMKKYTLKDKAEKEYKKMFK